MEFLAVDEDEKRPEEREREREKAMAITAPLCTGFLCTFLDSTMTYL